jgi:hypothetical protein
MLQPLPLKYIATPHYLATNLQGQSAAHIVLSDMGKKLNPRLLGISYSICLQYDVLPFERPLVQGSDILLAGMAYF